MTAGRALVTGAASGIGRAIAQRLVDDGWQVLAADREPDSAGPGEPLAVDLATREGNRAAVAAAVEQFGGLDVLVANAGFQARSLRSPSSTRIVGMRSWRYC